MPDGVDMRPKKARRPFTLYRKETQTGPIWYARFWDETARRYAVTRSTGIPVEGKRQRRYEAEQAAREMLGNIQFIPAAPEKSFVQYVADFWLPDSPYVREYALVKKRPLAIEYVLINHENVRRHMEPFSGFKDITFRNLTPGIIKDWMLWAAANGRGARSINVTLQAMPRKSIFIVTCMKHSFQKQNKVLHSVKNAFLLFLSSLNLQKCGC